MNNTLRSKNVFERFLGLFADIRAGEGATVVLLTLNVFLLLTAYYIIKPVREALILAGGSGGLSGAQLKSYAAAGQALLLLGVVPLYAMLVSRLPRRRLINVVTLFFIACLVLFYLLALLKTLLFSVESNFQVDLASNNISEAMRQEFEINGIVLSQSVAISTKEEGNEWLITDKSNKQTYSVSKAGDKLNIYKSTVPLGVIFYLWVGIFNLMVIAQFWSFANDVYTPEEGKRLFAIVAFGASAGAVLGGVIAGRLIEPLGVYQLMLVAGGLLVLSLLITNTVDSRERHKGLERSPTTPVVAEEPIGKGGAFQLVLKNRYLFLIALLILFLNWVNTTGEYILGSTVEQAAANAVADGTAGNLSQGQYIGKFYADFFSVVNVVGLVVQLFLVSRILKYLGVRTAILILPVIVFGGYALLAFYPVLSVVRWAKTAENSTDYSLQNTVRQVLFLPTTREQKYKAKQAIDTFFVRAGDVLQAVLVYVGTTWLAFQTKHFALFNLGLVLVWIILAILIGRENLRLTLSNGKAVEEKRN